MAISEVKDVSAYCNAHETFPYSEGSLQKALGADKLPHRATLAELMTHLVSIKQAAVHHSCFISAWVTAGHAVDTTKGR